MYEAKGLFTSGFLRERQIVYELRVAPVSAITGPSAPAGVMACSTPPFSDHGPQPEISIWRRIGNAVSWCHATSQFEAADLSNNVARNGAFTPRYWRAIRTSAGSDASARMAGTVSTWRVPALVRVSSA